MKKLLLIILMLPMSSWALVTARLTYGGLVSKDALKAACEGTVCAGQAPSMVPLYGLGGDVIISLPVIPFGFGVRYEKLGLDATSGSIAGDAELKRTALLINYRFIDTIVHFGLIGSYGLSHDASLVVKNSGTDVVNYDEGDLKTYSLGLEFEIKPLIVLPLVVGAEAGYMSAKWDNARNNINATTKNIDLSGSYIKVLLGLDF